MDAAGASGLRERPPTLFPRLGALCRPRSSCQPPAARAEPAHLLSSGWLLASGVFFLLFARPESSTSAWMACASPLRRASSSGRGRATATLISLKKSSLWTISSPDRRPSRPRGEGAAPSAGAGPAPCSEVSPDAFGQGDQTRCLSAWLFLKLGQASPQAWAHPPRPSVRASQSLECLSLYTLHGTSCWEKRTPSARFQKCPLAGRPREKHRA